MGGLSPFHWLILILVVLGPVFPVANILKRIGYSPWLAILYFVPLVSLVLLFVVGYSRWPRDKAEAAQAA